MSFVSDQLPEPPFGEFAASKPSRSAAAAAAARIYVDVGNGEVLIRQLVLFPLKPLCFLFTCTDLPAMWLPPRHASDADQSNLFSWASKMTARLVQYPVYYGCISAIQSE